MGIDISESLTCENDYFHAPERNHFDMTFVPVIEIKIV